MADASVSVSMLNVEAVDWESVLHRESVVTCCVNAAVYGLVLALAAGLAVQNFAAYFVTVAVHTS